MGLEPTADPPERETTAGGVEEFHRAGVTGENVTVGIVDATGFDQSHPQLAGRVDAARAFRDTGAFVPAVDRQHGTASAVLVARTAPDARLLLASVDSIESYRDAVEWLLDQNVDVILAPQSFLGRGRSPRQTSVTAQATQQGAVFVAPTGNLAASHWRGQFDPVAGNGSRTRHRFSAPPSFGSERNASRLLLRGDAEAVTLWLSWDDAHRGADFTAALYRVQNGKSTLVARSTPAVGDAVPNHRLVAETPSGDYYVVIHGPATASGAMLEVESSTHQLDPAVRRGSIAPPATDSQVLAVGALDAEAGTVEPFSGRGPTPKGYLGVDVVAPNGQSIRGRDKPFVGTSASAAYTTGIVALLLDIDPSLSVREVEAILERTATPVTSGSPDSISGYGRLSPVAAVNETQDRVR